MYEWDGSVYMAHDTPQRNGKICLFASYLWKSIAMDVVRPLDLIDTSIFPAALLSPFLTPREHRRRLSYASECACGSLNFKTWASCLEEAPPVPTFPMPTLLYEMGKKEDSRIEIGTALGSHEHGVIMISNCEKYPTVSVNAPITAHQLCRRRSLQLTEVE